MLSRELLQKFSKYVAMFYIFCFLVVTFYLSKMLSSVFQLTRIDDFAVIGDRLTLTGVLSIGIAGIGALLLWRNRKIKVHGLETAEELYQVDWPNKEQTKESIVVTVVISIVFSLILAVFDFIWSNAFSLILK